MSLHTYAISLAAVLLAYHQITTWLPLYPWNDVEKYSVKELLLEASWNGLLWWFPYFSPAFAKARNTWDYEAKFSRTAKLLAHQPGRRTPDANHIILHLLSLITVILVYCDRLASLR